MFKRLKMFFSKRKNLYKRVDALEKKIEEISKVKVEREETGVSTSQLIDEWINGEGGDND